MGTGLLLQLPSGIHVCSARAPAGEILDAGKDAFLEVLAAVQPDVVIAFSKRLGALLRPLCCEVPLATVHHPSTGFAYARWQPVIATTLDDAYARRRSLGVGACDSGQSPQYVAWRRASRKARAAHGPHLPPDVLADVHARWVVEMAVAKAAAR